MARNYPTHLYTIFSFSGPSCVNPRGGYGVSDILIETLLVTLTNSTYVKALSWCQFTRVFSWIFEFSKQFNKVGKSKGCFLS